MPLVQAGFYYPDENTRYAYYTGEPAGGWIKVANPFANGDTRGDARFALADPSSGIIYQAVVPGGYAPMVRTWGDSENGWHTDIVYAPDWIIKDPVAVKILQNGFEPTDLNTVFINQKTGVIEISPNTDGALKIYGSFARSIDSVTGGYIIGSNWDMSAINTRAINYRNSIYTGGDFITNALDAGAGVFAMMAAVGALAISGAGVGIANEVTQAVQTGATTASEAAAQTVATVAESAPSMTAAQIQAELNSLTMTTALDANAVNAAAQAGLISAAEQTTLLQTVAQGALDLSTTAGRQLAQKALEETAKSTQTPTPPQSPVPPTPAEQAAKLLKDQAIKIATGGASTLLKALTGGNSNAIAPRGYVRNPQTGELTTAPQSDSVLPIAIIAALIAFS